VPNCIEVHCLACALRLTHIRSFVPHTVICASTTLAKHKNKHLLEVARILLIHRRISKYLSDSALTAYYFINYMPSSVLEGLIMYSLLHPHKEPFACPHKDFLVFCFAYDNRTDSTKLDSRASKWCFLRVLKDSKVIQMLLS